METVKGFIKKLNAKAALRRCFKSAGLILKYKNGDKDITVYPKIHEYYFDQKKKFTRYVFTLANGMDPKEVLKKEFVFKQYFGNQLELEGDYKKFVLTIYTRVYNDAFPYKFSDFEEEMKKYSIPIIAGKDKLGNIVVYDMVKNPHLLIAGETGGGKSSILRVINTSLIQYKPHIKNGLEMYLVDFKRSEFHIFRYLEDVYVINQKKDLVKCLKNYLMKEIEQRGDLLDAHELTHIDDYNKLSNVEVKPYIILCIDEVHALEGERVIFEDLHTISAMGRALGIYLIMATQRPDKDVIEGKTKSNLTVRYAFAHADKINSDITLGRGTRADASKITKPGQFIYRNKSTLNNLQILQSPYLPADDETSEGGKKIIGAKTFLSAFKIPLEQRTNGDNSNVIDAEEFEERPTEEKLTVEDVFNGALKR